MNAPAPSQQTTMISVTKAWFTELQKSSGKRAELRRCQSLEEVFYCRAFAELYYPSLPFKKDKSHHLWQQRIACLAALLAAGPTEWQGGDKTLGQSLAKKKEGANALNPLRFRRMLTCKKINDLFPALRRALQVIKYQVPSHQLVNSIQHWGPQTRKQCALDYYQPEKKAKI